MTEFNIGDKVFLANYRSETGIVESRVEGTNDYMVRIDNDSLLVKVGSSEMSLICE